MESGSADVVKTKAGDISLGGFPLMMVQRELKRLRYSIVQVGKQYLEAKLRVAGISHAYRRKVERSGSLHVSHEVKRAECITCLKNLAESIDSHFG